jgi:hypothetical protein
MAFATTAVIAIILAIIINRGVRGIENKPFRGFSLIIVGFSLQLIIFNDKFANSSYSYLTPYIYVLSLFVLLAVVLLNLNYTGMRITLVAFLLNAIVIIANYGYMPQDIAKLELMGETEKVELLTKFGHYYNGTVMSTSTHLNFLGDIIAPTFLKPYAGVYSIGDIILIIGLCYFIFEFLKRKK